ncbi:MAG TPA: xanthine dehydrogenase family protein molybdopterin-binding subunit [Chloroflexota bacterium]|nr:xanthine dehydrogenase family protein molybdopterin-binding subunit [Chloroflexota bacterium]
MVGTRTFQVVGQAVPRLDGQAKVTGATRYAADVPRADALWAKAVRSPHPHARILRLDAAPALAVPGVRAVLTGANVPDVRIGRAMRDMPVLPRDEVRFAGEIVAVVAADDPDAAEEAALRVEAAYELLAAVFDPLEAMQPGAPLVHSAEAIRAAAHAEQRVPDLPNVLSLEVWTKGDVVRGFAEADHVFEHTFRTQLQHHGYVEPHACLAEVDEAGQIHVWASNKVPRLLQGYLADALGLPRERFVVHPTAVGGDFGGKGSYMGAPHCALLALRTGRPVRMVLGYGEELQAANPRHPAVVRLRTGVRRDGTLVAREARVVYNSGAYGAFKPIPFCNLPGAMEAAGEYRIPHVRIESYQVYTHQVPCGHMRAPGEPQVVFAAESQLDIIARALGMDPYAFRRHNALREGDLSPLGEPFEHVHAVETLDRAAAAADWGAPRRGPYWGRGMALAVKHANPGAYDAEVRCTADGGADVVSALVDTGTGLYTVLQQIVAEELGLPPAAVGVRLVDPAHAPADSGVSASRVTELMGKAVQEAAAGLRAQVQAAAAPLLGCPPEAVRLEDGACWGGGRTVSLAAVVAAAGAERLVGRGHAEARAVGHVPSFHVQVAEVEVDPETGAVRVERIVGAHDVGTVIHPIGHQGQIDGGTVQALGYALLEEVALEDGRVQTAHLGEYKLPTMADVPPLVTALLQDPSGPGPYQGKGIGEGPNCPLAAAIANAVEDAVGVRIYELPITAEKVRRALQAKARAAPAAEAGPG